MNEVIERGEKLSCAEIYSLRDMRQRQRDYLLAVEPIARERARLAMMFTRLVFFPATGKACCEYPPQIKAIDDKYVELTKVLQCHFFGKTLDAACAGES